MNEWHRPDSRWCFKAVRNDFSPCHWPWCFQKLFVKHCTNKHNFILVQTRPTSAPFYVVSYKRIQQWAVCRRERSRWFHAGLSLHSAHWGVPRRPGLSSAPPSLTWCQTWGGGGGSVRRVTHRYHLRCVAELINISETGEMLSASVTTWNS